MITGKLVLEVNEPLTVEEQKSLRYLFLDALQNFKDTRFNNAYEYVKKSYVDKDGVCLIDFNTKVEEVQGRLDLATELREDLARHVEVRVVPRVAP